VLAIKTSLESGPVTADLTTTVIHSYKLLINDVKPVHSLTHSMNEINIKFMKKLTNPKYINLTHSMNEINIKFMKKLTNPKYINPNFKYLIQLSLKLLILQ